MTLLAPLALGVALLAGCTSAAEPAATETTTTETEAPAEWGYVSVGGPDEWASIDEDYAACGVGEHQSPIDLPDEVPTDAAGTLDISSSSTTAQATDTGHTIQLAPDADSETLT